MHWPKKRPQRILLQIDSSAEMKALEHAVCLAQSVKERHCPGRPGVGEWVKIHELAENSALTDHRVGVLRQSPHR